MHSSAYRPNALHAVRFRASGTQVNAVGHMAFGTP